MFFIPVFTELTSVQVFQSKDTPEKLATPEELIRMTKGITVATAKSVAAGNSGQQEDVIATANLSRKAVSDMLLTCKVLIALAQQSPSHSSSHTHRCTDAHLNTQRLHTSFHSAALALICPASKEACNERLEASVKFTPLLKVTLNLTSVYIHKLIYSFFFIIHLALGSFLFHHVHSF